MCNYSGEVTTERQDLENIFDFQQVGPGTIKMLPLDVENHAVDATILCCKGSICLLSSSQRIGQGTYHCCPLMCNYSGEVTTAIGFRDSCVIYPTINSCRSLVKKEMVDKKALSGFLWNHSNYLSPYTQRRNTFLGHSHVLIKLLVGQYNIGSVKIDFKMGANLPFFEDSIFLALTWVGGTIGCN